MIDSGSLFSKRLKWKKIGETDKGIWICIVLAPMREGRN